MAVYRFRVTLDDYDDVNRDIEIKSTQTFAELLPCILESFKFDTKHAASFFVSDDYWRKNDEITLLEEDLEDGVRLMSKTKIASTVISPYQRFILIYDKDVQWNFMIEMIKILNDDPKAKYPLCSKTVGAAPKQYKNLKPPVEAATGADALLAAMLGGGAAAAAIDDDDLDDDEAYKAHDGVEAVDEDDFKMMENEEGEEGTELEGEDDETGEHGEDEYSFEGGDGEDY